VVVVADGGGCNVLAGNYLLKIKQNKFNKITSFILNNFLKRGKLKLQASLQ